MSDADDDHRARRRHGAGRSDDGCNGLGRGVDHTPAGACLDWGRGHSRRRHRDSRRASDAVEAVRRGCRRADPRRDRHAPAWWPCRGGHHRPRQRRCGDRLGRHQGVGHLVDRRPRAIRGTAVRRHRLRRPRRAGGGRLTRGAARWDGSGAAGRPGAARAAGDRSRPRRGHRRGDDVGRHARPQR